MRFLFIAAFCVLALASCKNDQDGKSAIDRRNEQVAEEAVQAIKTPLEQTKKAVEQENLRNNQMDGLLKSQ